MQAIICFTSDFGMGDTWVGMCHAVIYRACPQARVVDLAHDIEPYDIRKAAAVAASGAWQLPDAIHLVVVDPGVGGGRRDVVLVTVGGAVLVGPDNGVLIPASHQAGGIERAFAVVPEHLNFQPPLATFHARDVLAPCAAALACGVDASAVGDPIDPETLVPGPFAPGRREGDTLVAEIVDVDRFGSARIAITGDDLAAMVDTVDLIEIAVGHLVVEVPFRRTFADVGEGEAVALIDSSGWLTLAVRQGSAAERFGMEPGSLARVRVAH